MRTCQNQDNKSGSLQLNLFIYIIDPTAKFDGKTVNSDFYVSITTVIYQISSKGDVYKRCTPGADRADGPSVNDQRQFSGARGPTELKKYIQRL